MRQNIIASLLNVLCAAFIGLLVGIVLMFVYTIENPLRHLATSSLIGIMIGATTKISAILMHQYGPKKLYWSYILTFIITLIGSILATLGEPLTTLIVLAIAEPLALLITFMNVKNICHLNDDLKRKQALFKQTKI
jgi:Na+-driven multidrug efflux pump